MFAKLRRRLRGLPPVPETGEENAQRFVRVVSRLARDERMIICYPQTGYGGSPNERTGWVWMINPKWQARVLELLKDAPVREPRFDPPDSMDGWTFSAYSTVPVPRIAKLDLNDRL